MLENSTTPDSDGQASPDRPPPRKFKRRRWTKGQRDAVESANGHPVPAETEHYGPRWDGDFARNGEKSLLPDVKGPDLLREIRRMTTESGAEWDSRAEVWYAEVTRRCSTISLFENMAKTGAETWIVDIARRMYEREAERRGVVWRWTATCEKAVALMVLTHRIGAVGLQSAQVNVAHYLGTSYETMRDRLNPRLEAAGIWDITETRREGQAGGRYKRVRGQYVRTMGSKLIKACGSLAILQGVPGLVFADGRELEPATVKARKNKRRSAIVARRESREDAYQRRNTRSRASSLSGVVSAPPSPLSVRGVPVPSPDAVDGRDEDLAPLAAPSASPPRMRDISVRSSAVAPEPADSNPASEGMVGVSPAFEDILRESESTSGFVADFLLRAKRALHLLVFFVSVATAACGFGPQGGAERHTDANSKSDCGRTTARAHRTSCSAGAGHRHEAGYSSRGRDRQVRRSRSHPRPRSDGLEATHAGRDRRDARRIRGPPTPSEDTDMITISEPDQDGRFRIFGRLEPDADSRNIQFEWTGCHECVVNAVSLHANMGAGKRNTNLRVMGIATGKPPLGDVTLAHKVPKTLEAGDLAIALRGPSKAKYYEIKISATATDPDQYRSLIDGRVIDEDYEPPEVPEATPVNTEPEVRDPWGEPPIGVDRSEDPVGA